MFVPNSFTDGVAGGTPITAATLNNLENGLVAADVTNPASAAAVAIATLGATYAPAATPAGLALTKRFDPARQVYNLTSSSFRRWRAALGAAANGTAIARLNCYGDSITFGAFATPNSSVANAPQRLRERIAKRTSVTGTGVVYPIDYSGSDLRWTFAGSWSTLNGYGPFGFGCQQVAAITDNVTFAPLEAIDTFAITYYSNTPTGIIRIQVDGGTATTLDTSNATGLSVQTSTIAAGSAGIHTLKITAPADGKPFFLIGIEASAGTSGIRVTTCAKTGTKYSDLMLDAVGDNRASPVAAIDSNKPNLAILHFGMNEYFQQVPIATFTANAQAAIDRVRVTNLGDVLLVMTNPDGGVLKTIPQTAYQQALYGLADTNNVPLLDLYERWGSYAISNATPLALYGDTAHPNSRGYADHASALFDIVMAGM